MPEKDTIVEVDDEPENIDFGINLDSFKVTKYKIKHNAFLAHILLPHHINYVTIDALAKKSKDIFGSIKSKNKIFLSFLSFE